MRNTKMYPVLPDGADQQNIPTTLESWWNNHWFPSGNEAPRRMIADAPVETALAGSNGDEDTASTDAAPETNFHRRWAIKALATAVGKTLLQALKHDFAIEHTPSVCPQSAIEMVDHFTQNGD